MRVHNVCVIAAAIAAAALAGQDAPGQDFPAKPIRIIVSYAAGGGTDITTRIAQAKVTEMLGWRLIVDNRVGGGTLIGTRAVQTASPDGYTLGVMDPAFIINPALLADAGYDALKDLHAHAFDGLSCALFPAIRDGSAH